MINNTARASENNFDVIRFLTGLELIYPETEILSKTRSLLQTLDVNVPAANHKSLQQLMDLLSLSDKISDSFFKGLFRAMNRFPDMAWNDILSRGQLLSKIWLIEELKKTGIDLGCVFVCAGWVGMLPALMLRDPNLKFSKIRSFDIDPACANAADTLNKQHVFNGLKFKASTCDILDIDYTSFLYTTVKSNGIQDMLEDIPNTIINTSCDHIERFDRWWSLVPNDRLIVLQNNDAKGLDSDHVNTVADIEEFKSQCPMQKILFQGSLQLPKFNRYMLIGYKSV